MQNIVKTDEGEHDKKNPVIRDWSKSIGGRGRGGGACSGGGHGSWSAGGSGGACSGGRGELDWKLTL